MPPCQPPFALICAPQVCTEEREVDAALTAALREASPSTQLRCEKPVNGDAGAALTLPLRSPRLAARCGATRSTTWTTCRSRLRAFPTCTRSSETHVRSAARCGRRCRLLRSGNPPPRSWRVRRSSGHWAFGRRCPPRRSLEPRQAPPPTPDLCTPSPVASPLPSSASASTSGTGTASRSTRRPATGFWALTTPASFHRGSPSGAEPAAPPFPHRLCCLTPPLCRPSCLSPRRVHEEVRRYEKARVANQSTYWILFELLWRDFFRFSAIKWGNSMFHYKGPKRELPRERWTRDANRIRAWSEGQTGALAALRPRNRRSRCLRC